MIAAANNPLLTPEGRNNPYPFFAMARQFMPVMFVEQLGVWSAFRYDDCRAILTDPRRFSSDFRPNQPPELQRESPSILNLDPPLHDKLRNLVSRAFTPRMIAQLEPRIRQVADELIEAVRPTGAMDLVDDLSYPLPVIMIAEILGVPPDDREHFRRWSDEVVAALGSGISMEAAVPPEQAIRELRAYFTRIIEDRRAEPRNDLVSALIAAEIDGEHLDIEALLAFCILLLVAGNETTTNLISNTIRCLVEGPASLDRLRADASLWPSAIEEVLRFRPSVQATIRRVTEDVELRGQQIKAGQAIVIWLAAANRDPEEFPDPDRFDITRSPNRHLGFGQGIHFCLGAPLARLEARVALEEIARRLPNLRRANDDPYEPLSGFVMNGLKRLPLLFEAS